MPTTLRILGWRSEGLRCPDHRLDCCQEADEPARVSLIQMPNGTGKTTTLELLRAALSGTAEAWDAAKVRSLRKQHSAVDRGLFELRLSLDGKALTIVMEFLLNSGTVRYKTTWHSGQTNGFRPPRQLRRFMDDQFVHFYVFNGELAQRLLRRDETDAESAVQRLFQLNILGAMRARIERYWEEQTRGRTAKDRTGHTRRINKVARWRRRLTELEQRQTEIQTELKLTQDRLHREQKKFDEAFKKDDLRREERADAEKKRTRLEHEMHQQLASLLDAMRDPHALSTGFAKAMSNLKDGLDHVKLPESAAREFFEELAREDECVCGREIDDPIRGLIRDRAQHYLGTDDVSVLNAMKFHIGASVGDSVTQASQALMMQKCALSTTVNTYYDAQNDLDALVESFSDSDVDLKRLAEDIAGLKSKCSGLQEGLDRLQDKGDNVDPSNLSTDGVESIESIDAAKAIIRVLDTQVAEAADTLDLRAKRRILTGLIDAATKDARTAIGAEICEETNVRIQELMPYNHIRVDSIDGCLKLRDQARGSEGENLSVAYAFLSTLFDRAEQHHLPFVVDSPAGSIDYDIRVKVGALVPRLTGQFVAFVISSEREKFVPSVVDSVDGNVQFVTLFRRGKGKLEEQASGQASSHVSRDGYLVYGEEFFSDFQLDEE